MLTINLICYIMALNSDIRCLRFSKNIYNNQHVLWLHIPNKQDLFYEACRYGKLNLVKLLLPNIDVTANNNSGIRWGCHNGHLEVVDFLLHNTDADPTAGDNYCIRMACKHNFPEIVKLLLMDNRVDMSAYTNYALKWAKVNDYMQVFGILEDYFENHQ